MRSLIALLAISAVPWLPASAAGTADDRAEIERAFETVFDQSRPLDERLPLVQNSDRFTSLIKSIPRQFADVTARARNVRVHGRKAEAELAFYDRRRPLIGFPMGIAVRNKGNWLVSGFTVCEVVNWVRPCSMHLVSDAYYRAEPFPLTSRPGLSEDEVGLALPDGTGLAVRMASNVDTARLAVLSDVGLEASDDGRPPLVSGATAYFRPPRAPILARYPGVNGTVIDLDYRGYLNFYGGDWVIRVSAAHLSEPDRSFIAGHLRVVLTDEGFVQPLGDAHLRMETSAQPAFGGPGRSAISRPAKGGLLGSSPQLTITSVDGRPPIYRIEIARTGCSQPGHITGLLPEDLVAIRCFDEGIEMGISGSDPESVRTFITESSLRVTRGPTDPVGS